VAVASPNCGLLYDVEAQCSLVAHLPWAREVPFQTIHSVSRFLSLSNNLRLRPEGSHCLGRLTKELVEPMSPEALADPKGLICAASFSSPHSARVHTVDDSMHRP
jgi:hypothetical protein